MRPRPVVVDASVAVKWFKRQGESGLADALALLDLHLAREITLTAPESLRLEVLNALWSHRLVASDLDQAAADLEDLRLAWYGLDRELSRHAGALAANHDLTVYDAAYVALALRLDAELVTADRALACTGACRTRLLG